MVEGTYADNVLSGTEIEFKLGIIGVCNRSQKQLDNNISIEEAAQSEKDYFKEHYPKFADKCGIKYLIKRMNEVCFFFIFLNIFRSFSCS